MFMILSHHFIVHNGYDVLKLPLGPERIFFQLVMAGGGKVGVVIFFSISTWFFLDKEQTIKSNLRRVWIMERELLFWSLILVTFYLVFDRADLSMKLMVKSVMPLSMGVWWYATAYAIFLALLPFLAKGLKALGREYHLKLAATVLVIWGLTSFIPGAQSLTDNVFGFIYVFILISAYKWHMMPFTTKQVWLMTGIGLGFFLLYTAASATLSLLGHDMGIFITGSWKLPVILVGFGVFLLFDRVTFHSRVINRIAQSAFAVYLITDYAASEKLLWARLFNLQDLYQQPLAILQILGILLAIYYQSLVATMGSSYGIKAFLSAVLGGLTDVGMAAVGGFCIGVIENIGITFSSANFRDAFAFLFLLIVLLIRPQGFVKKKGARP